MSGLFVNTSTADDKYSFLNRNNLLQHLQMQLSRKEKKHFRTLFLPFGDVDKILKIFKEK